MRTRPLVLTTESARHPFRQSLPPHVFRVRDESARKPKRMVDDDQDWKLFALSFCAFFTAFYSFIF
ncbi:MAG: hypothetical protein COC10_06935 [Sphingobium sp.]|jgi:hypothetical protein|nr:MAG: hypothetical protein COC10_06935 [Sphingobium sp.]